MQWRLSTVLSMPIMLTWLSVLTTLSDMKKPVSNIPPPVPPRISQSLRELKKGESLLFGLSTSGSIMAIVTRIKREFGYKRDFTSRTEPDGVRVWRIE